MTVDEYSLDQVNTYSMMFQVDIIKQWKDHIE